MLTRKQFLQLGGLSLIGSTLPSFKFADAEDPNKIRVGLCGGRDNIAIAKSAGCSYIEAGVASTLMPGKSESEYKKILEGLSSPESLRIECFNVFLPKELKSVGDQANHDGIMKYASVAFERAETIGAEIIVFGSSGSRTIPDGFDRSKAKDQFIALCKRLARIAEKHRITLAIEQLNKEETNFINRLQESAEIVEAVRHPNVKMMCDIYHALRENDPPSELIRFGDHLVHCHIAEKKDRSAPGVIGDDFKPYFSALKKINYRGRLSLECNWKDIKIELPVAVAMIREQWAGSQ